jgi:hypothetical protein
MCWLELGSKMYRQCVLVWKSLCETLDWQVGVAMSYTDVWRMVNIRGVFVANCKQHVV